MLNKDTASEARTSILGHEDSSYKAMNPSRSKLKLLSVLGLALVGTVGAIMNLKSPEDPTNLQYIHHTLTSAI